ncbi:MAG: hypothetical protein HZB19_12790 [Chloroflexi bacterium]|nr:hypothetical protein [Chloroflexota bacterium]
MTEMNRFALMLEALTELVAEEKQTPNAGHRPALPSLQDVLSEAAPFPSEALFLGLAEDGLPVLLNLYDPVPGPLLVTGDPASGKTNLLKVIARAAELMHEPGEVEYSVITSNPDEWVEFQEHENNAGVYSAKDNTAQDLLYSLVSWAHNNKGEKQSVLLLIDDLEPAAKLSHEAEQNLRWLLLRGPSRRVWPIVTLKANRTQQMEAWLGFFRTRMFGNIQNIRDVEILTGLQNIPLDHLISGSQLTMREGNKWLNFWIPKLD